MGLNSEDPIKFIKHLLESKSSAKQTAYKHICKAFSILSDESKIIVEELKRRAKPSDQVAPSFTEVKSITLNQKRDHTLELGGAQKIGFRNEL